MNIFGSNSFYLIIMSTFFCTISFLSQANDNQLNNKLSVFVKADTGYIDNFLSSGVDEKGTGVFVLSPQIDFRSEGQQSLLEIDANVEHVSYNQFSDDNHIDYKFSPTYQYKFSRNKALFLTGDYNHSYELRGTGISIGDAENLSSGDEKATYHARVGFKYGSEHSSARWTIDSGITKSEYTTRRAATKIVDNQIFSIKSGFDYLLSGKTYLAFELQHNDISFENNEVLDSTKKTALAGVKWATTEISELQFLLGYQKVSFSEKTFSDDSTFKWRIDYIWKPTENSEFHFLSERSFEETNRLQNSYNVSDRHHISAILRLSEYFHFNLNAGVVNQEINFQSSRESEDIFTGSIVFSYLSSERLRFNFSYELNDLSATNSIIDYQRNGILLGVELQL